MSLGAHLPDLLAVSSQLAPARSQMAFTLGFHIVLASLGVAFPAMMLIANYRGLRHDDQDALLLARRGARNRPARVGVRLPQVRPALQGAGGRRADLRRLFAAHAVLH